MKTISRTNIYLPSMSVRCGDGGILIRVAARVDHSMYVFQILISEIAVRLCLMRYRRSASPLP